METKKMYEQPKFEEVKIATNQILCASDMITPAPGMHEITDGY